MNRTQRKRSTIAVLCLLHGLLIACAESAPVDLDTDDTSGDSDADTDADSDTDTDTDSDADTDSDTGSDVPQGPIAMVISNNSAEPIYLSDYTGPDSVVRCTDPDGQRCHLFAPFCTLSCDDSAIYDYCMIDCSLMLQVIAILPGESFGFDWPGTMNVMNGNKCVDGGECYENVTPQPGDHNLSIFVFDDASCYEDCSAGTGIYSGEVLGDSRLATATLAVPSADDVVISVE